VFAFLEPSY